MLELRRPNGKSDDTQKAAVKQCASGSPPLPRSSKVNEFLGVKNSSESCVKHENNRVVFETTLGKKLHKTKSNLLRKK